MHVDKKELLEEIKRCRKTGVVSDKLADFIVKMAKNYANKSNFRNYSYVDDMVGYGIEMLFKGALKFDPEKSSQPFSYYTTVIHRAFLNFIATEKRHSRLRDEMHIAAGLLPSYARQLEEEEKAHALRTGTSSDSEREGS